MVFMLASLVTAGTHRGCGGATDRLPRWTATRGELASPRHETVRLQCPTRTVLVDGRRGAGPVPTPSPVAPTALAESPRPAYGTRRPVRGGRADQTLRPSPQSHRHSEDRC